MTSVWGVFHYGFASSSKEVSLQTDEAISSWRARQNKVFHQSISSPKCSPICLRFREDSLALTKYLKSSRESSKNENGVHADAECSTESRVFATASTRRHPTSRPSGVSRRRRYNRGIGGRVWTQWMGESDGQVACAVIGNAGEYELPLKKK